MHTGRCNGSSNETWSLLDGRCYFFSRRATDWRRAEALCRQRGTQLVSVRDHNENDFVRSTFDAIVAILLVTHCRVRLNGLFID